MSSPLLRSALLALACACAPARDTENDARPPVILVSIDTLRADHLGLYGYERDTSPFLDRLARESVVYERAFTPATWTLSAHMSMLTGLLPVEHGVEHEDVALSPQVPLLAERLRAAGYQNVALYFRGWIDESRGFGRGFDLFRSHRNAEEAGAHLDEALRRIDPERPWFLFLHLFDVHSAPFGPTNRTIYCAPEPYGEHFLTDGHAPLPDLPAQEMWEDGKRLDSEQIRTLVAHYDGGIRYVDAKLEQWYGRLEREGWLDRALVIVTSDHGEALGQRAQVLDNHGSWFQEGVRVPLLVRHPGGLRAGERVESPVHLTDLVPTILEHAGLETAAGLAGRSLLGPVPEGRVLAGTRSDHGYAVAWPRKLLSRGDGRVFEFDLATDPRERRGRRVEGAEFEELLQLAHGARGPFPEPVPIGALSAEDRELLEALGYGGEVE